MTSLDQTVPEVDRTSPFDAAEFADHLAASIAGKGYRSGLTRQLWVSTLAVVVSLVLGVLALVLLLTAELQPPADAFWLLCLVLAGGLFCVAEFTLVGSLVSHLAMSRFAEGQRDLEVFEAVQEYETLRERVAALSELVQTIDRHEASEAETELVAESLVYICRPPFPFDTGGRVRPVRDPVLDAWKARGADEVLVEKLAMQSSVEPSTG